MLDYPKIQRATASARAGEEGAGKSFTAVEVVERERIL